MKNIWKNLKVFLKNLVYYWIREKLEKDPFKEIYDIIQDASLFNLDNEVFDYNIDRILIKIENIEYLIKLKNKINIQPQQKIKEN